MAIEQTYFETVLQEALTERDTQLQEKQLQEKQLPEINIGEAIPINEGLDFADEYVEYGVLPRCLVLSKTA